MFRQTNTVNTPFVNADDAIQTLNEKQLKTASFNIDKFVSDNLNPEFEAYKPHELLFLTGQQAYVNVVSFCSENQTYKCRKRALDNLDQSSFVEATFEELSPFITVTVKLLQFGGEAERTQELNFNLFEKVNESIELLTLASFKTTGPVLFKGKLVSNDETFGSLNVLPTDVFLVKGGGGARVTPIRWKRSPVIDFGAYHHMQEGRPDALKFKARRNVAWCGVLWTRELDNKPFEIKFKWRVDDAELCEEVQVQCTPE